MLNFIFKLVEVILKVVNAICNRGKKKQKKAVASCKVDRLADFTSELRLLLAN